MEFTGFDWDRYNRDKVQRHGVSIEEIESLFSNTVKTARDPGHSAHEERIKAFGRTTGGRALLVIFTIRLSEDEATLIRPISARYMHAKEATWYEKETSNTQE